ncbi:7678_t:CDS:2, partial [Dentiscutata heterogama]
GKSLLMERMSNFLLNKILLRRRVKIPVMEVEDDNDLIECADKYLVDKVKGKIIEKKKQNAIDIKKNEISKTEKPKEGESSSATDVNNETKTYSGFVYGGLWYNSFSEDSFHTPKFKISNFRAHQINKAFFPPTYNESTKSYECISKLDYSELQTRASHTTILEQASGFGAIATLLFNVAVYGVTSQLSLRNTCILDDLLIFTFSLVPIFSCTVLTRSISSFFSHDKDIIVEEIKNYGFRLRESKRIIEQYKFVFLDVVTNEHATRLLCQQNLYLKAYSRKNEENKTALNFIKNFQKLYLNKIFLRELFFEKLYLEKKSDHCLKKLFSRKLKRSDLKEPDNLNDLFLDIFEDCMKSNDDNEDCMKSNDDNEDCMKSNDDNEKFEKNLEDCIIDIKDHKIYKRILGKDTIAEKLIEHACVYMNILEAGIFQYLTYSHRSAKKEKIYKNDKLVVNWVIIPAFSEINVNVSDKITKMNTEEEFLEEILEEILKNNEKGIHEKKNKEDENNEDEILKNYEEVTRDIKKEIESILDTFEKEIERIREKIKEDIIKEGYIINVKSIKEVKRRFTEYIVYIKFIEIMLNINSKFK